MKHIIVILIMTVTLNVTADELKNTTVAVIAVTKKGFEPNEVSAPPGNQVILKITRKTKATCATEIQIPKLNIKKDLPLDQEVTIDLGKLQKGQINFGCGMSMMEAGIINIK
jgi:plastocyanin domain-containing protein